MVAPALAAAAVTAAGGVLQSFLGIGAQNRQNRYNSPEQVRARAEAAGFNPLLFVGPGVGQQTTAYVPQFGNAIADAAQVYTSVSQRERELDQRQAQIDMAQEQAEQALTRATLRPNVPGIYGQSGQNPILPNVTTEVPILYDAELNRIDLPRGGATGDNSVHHIDLPWPLGGFSMERPFAGERMEGYSGDILAAPLTLPFLFSDLAHNMVGQYYDPERQEWRWMPPPEAVPGYEEYFDGRDPVPLTEDDEEARKRFMQEYYPTVYDPS